MTTHSATGEASEDTAADDPWRDWRGQLQQSGLLISAGPDGLWAGGEQFETIIEALERMARRLASDQKATLLRFPPIVPEEVVVKSDYVRSFPDLIGAVTVFEGNDRDHRDLLKTLEDGHDWAAHLRPSHLMLCSAACHPLYRLIADQKMPSEGSRYDIYGWAFRHEPSLDPTRRQAFRMYEVVYVGGPEGALAHRDFWLQRGLESLSALGLEVHSELATDPFFGRVGDILASSQEAAALKYEIVAPAGPTEKLTAISSANYHEAHLGSSFGFMASDGGVGHSACFGFGLDRITLALLWRHGLEPARWPAAVRSLLWGD